eukprot:m.94220 g.94220  ORF g.94220 m.94220 type:complete len:233 (-) comp26698_c0_seq4:460-1158(-)
MSDTKWEPLAVVFDLDGLLIDSEPWWHVAIQKMFANIGLTLSENDCLETTGLRIDEAVLHYFKRSPWDDIAHPKQKIVDNIVNEMATLLRDQAKEMRGACDLVRQFQKFPHIKLALASSSPKVLIVAGLERLGLTKAFEVVCSAEHEEYGKPHPAVYISAAKELRIHPTRCVAFEDSLNGTLAAKAARMKCVSVPDVDLQQNTRKMLKFSIADVVLSSLDQHSAEEILHQLL